MILSFTLKDPEGIKIQSPGLQTGVKDHQKECPEGKPENSTPPSN